MLMHRSASSMLQAESSPALFCYALAIFLTDPSSWELSPAIVSHTHASNVKQLIGSFIRAPPMG